MSMNHDAAAKVAADVISIGIVVGTLSSILPAIAALASIIWTLIRIYETRTVQRLLGRDVPQRRDEKEE